MGKVGILAILAGLLAGCVTPNAEGTMLNDNTALISSTGSVDRMEIVDNALKGAANVTSAHGYRYFVILTADNTSTSTTMFVPGLRLQMPSNRSFGRTNFFTATGATYTAPDRMVTRFKPGLDIIIQMYRQGEIDPNILGVWNADVVLGRFASAQ